VTTFNTVASTFRDRFQLTVTRPRGCHHSPIAQIAVNSVALLFQQVALPFDLLVPCASRKPLCFGESKLSSFACFWGLLNIVIIIIISDIL
jgi:hypothetical protein